LLDQITPVVLLAELVDIIHILTGDGKREQMTEIIIHIIPPERGCVAGKADVIVLARGLIHKTGDQFDRHLHACRRNVVPDDLHAAFFPVQIQRHRGMQVAVIDLAVKRRQAVDHAPGGFIFHRQQVMDRINEYQQTDSAPCYSDNRR